MILKKLRKFVRLKSPGLVLILQLRILKYLQVLQSEYSKHLTHLFKVKTQTYWEVPRRLDMKTLLKLRKANDLNQMKFKRLDYY